MVSSVQLTGRAAAASGVLMIAGVQGEWLFNPQRDDGTVTNMPVFALLLVTATAGFALLLSALTVHFRDLRDILSNLLTFWFFATPIIYPYFSFPADSWQGQLLKLNPFTHLAITYQEILFFQGPVGHLKWLLVLGVISIGFFFFSYFLFDRLRDTFAEEV